MVRFMRGAAAWLATLVVMSLATVEMPHLTGGHHDVDVDIIVVAHDADAHHVSGGQVSPPRAEHCLACHWGRSFRQGAGPGVLSVPVAETAVRSITQHDFVPGPAPVAQPPLRSPPA